MGSARTPAWARALAEMLERAGEAVRNLPLVRRGFSFR
jgi:hypothetical protein